MPLLVSWGNRGGILGKLSGILNRSRDLRPLQEPVRKVLLDANKVRAMKGLDFTGKPYAPLARSTLEDRRRHGYPPGPPLNRRGPDARVIVGCVVTVTPGDGRIGYIKGWPSIPWLEYHVTGGPRLPRRDPLGFSVAELDAARKLLPKHVLLGRSV